jgi:RHS repeat-associated protein
VSYAYDARGNITGNGFQTFTFDRANEITAVNTSLATYRYDANKKRVRTISGGSTVYSVYGQDGVLLHKDNATTGARTDYVYAGGQLVAEVGATPVYIHSDQLGSPVAGTDTAGAVAWTERYAPYGDQLLAPPATQDNLAYTGHHSDADTGLIYMEARYYDPLIGRFYSNDPVGFTETNPVSFNRYAYANNNPYRFTDPDGQLAWFAPMAIGAVVGGGFNLAVQLFRSGGDVGAVNWSQVGVAAAAGAVGSAAGVVASTAATTGGMIGANMIAGAAIGAGAAHANALLDGQIVNVGDVAEGAALAAGLSGVAAGISAVPAAAQNAKVAAMTQTERVATGNLVRGVATTTESAGGNPTVTRGIQALADAAAVTKNSADNLTAEPEQNEDLQ